VVYQVTVALSQLDQTIAAAQRSLDRVAGRAVNANSAPQMRALFGAEKCEGKWYTKSGFELETTGGGEASIGKRSLEIMARQGHEVAGAVMLVRKMTKAKQFLKDHILGHEFEGRVYPNYNQTRGDNELGTGTGRLSINDPALQQIPARDVDVAAVVRSLFLPEPGHVWGCADWEQFEFRWFAHYTKDPSILKTYEENPDADFHQTVSEITGIPRNAKYAGAPNSKQINLGLVFGMGEGEMAYQMGMDYTTRKDERGREWKNAGPQAKAIFSKYHSSIPGVRKILDEASSIAASRGYVMTAMGRHIRFPKGAYYKAGGLVFQGTSADCMKQKMVECHAAGFNLMLSVHDELGFSMPKGKAKKLAVEAKAVLEQFDGVKCPIFCRVPIRSSIKMGTTWWQACKKD
jgi:DNA polymerase I-like protein with 3'-5' exonuclease and polymerase domains